MDSGEQGNGPEYAGEACEKEVGAILVGFDAELASEEEEILDQGCREIELSIEGEESCDEGDVDQAGNALQVADLSPRCVSLPL